MNNVDKQYLTLMREILDHGTLKHTRAGDTLSIFGKMMEFNLQEGLPLLTTKKVFYKGAIHELLWFLKGDTNIKYLVDNNVHIWDDDAYRWFKSLDFKSYKVKNPECIEGMYKLDRCIFELDELDCKFSITNDEEEEVISYDIGEFNNQTMKKEHFINTFVKGGAKLKRKFVYNDRVIRGDVIYTFGDLGPVYGKQWRGFGIKKADQINNIINSLKNNPDDRRMLCTALNPDVLDEVALPPCHVMFQFYTRKLTHQERFTWLQENGDNKYDEWKTATKERLDGLGVPERELSISFSMRSNDAPLGLPLNMLEYSILCHIIANICNMTVGRLIYFGGDIHIYTNQIEACKEQLERKGFDKLPKLIIKRKLENIDDINYDDLEIVNYNSDPVIKFPLSVG